MISYHRCNRTPYDDRAYGAGFLIADTSDLVRLSRGIAQFPWSPIIWRDGVRQQANFIQAQYAVLDLDDGSMTIDDALRSFCDVQHIIGTTRSHTDAQHRLRVVIPYERSITDLREYRYNTMLITERYSSDKTCKDGARFFYPCKQIISVQTVGDLWGVALVPENFENPKMAALRAELAVMKFRRRGGRLPNWCEQFLTKGIHLNDVPSRQTMGFRVASQMKLAGIPETEAYSLLLKAPIDRTNFDAEKELGHAVRSAYKR